MEEKLGDINQKYVIEDNKLIKYKLDEKIVDLSDLPDYVDTIAPGAFSCCKNLEKLEGIGKIKHIEPYAFYCCRNLNIPLNISDDILFPNAFYKAQKAALEHKYIDSFKDEKFFIKNYQRGYRWTQTEVTELLNDIAAISADDNGYCMQPLVLKRIGKNTRETYKCELEPQIDKDSGLKGFEDEQAVPIGTYELIDGQQRLTTLWLILNYLGETEKYKIFYELIRKVDETYLRDAKTTIRRWFEQEGHGAEDYIKDFRENLKKLFFIWYEVKNENDSPEDIFKSVNDGKVPLTNAELFKALLLNPDNIADFPEKEKKLEQIAFEWDKLESQLRDDDFWYFISNDSTDKKTRIDYIIEVYADNLKKEVEKLSDEYNKVNKRGKKEEKNNFLDSLCKEERLKIDIDFSDLEFNKDRFAFLIVQRYIDKLLSNNENQFEVVKNIWENIIKVFDKLYSWYKDDELYHSIGFLVVAEERNKGSKATASEVVCELYRNYHESDLNFVKSEIRQKIYDDYFTVIEEEMEDVEDGKKSKKTRKPVPLTFENVAYDQNRGCVKNILLFSNIYTMYFQHLESNTINSTGKKDSGKEEPKKSSRFPFSVYKSLHWDIEHINPQTIETDFSKQTETTFIMSIKALIKELEKSSSAQNYGKELESLKNYISEYEKLDKGSESYNEDSYKHYKNDKVDFSVLYDKCCDIWKDYVKKKNENPNNSLSNLTLLDASTNRGYGNAFFNRKRSDIIERDKEGKFVPVCTKNVFMKYYSEEPDNFVVWTTIDDDNKQAENTDEWAYKQQLEKMFNCVKTWNKKQEINNE